MERERRELRWGGERGNGEGHGVSERDRSVSRVLRMTPERGGSHGKGHRPVKKRKDSSRRVPDILQSEKDYDFRVSTSARRDRASAVRVRAPRRSRPRVLVHDRRNRPALRASILDRRDKSLTKAGSPIRHENYEARSKKPSLARDNRPAPRAPGAVAAREATSPRGADGSRW